MACTEQITFPLFLKMAHEQTEAPYHKKAIVTEGLEWPSLVADGKVYLPNEKYLNILAAGRELKLLNQIRLDFRSWGTPVAANGTLYIVSKNELWAVKQRSADE